MPSQEETPQTPPSPLPGSTPPEKNYFNKQYLWLAGALIPLALIAFSVMKSGEQNPALAEASKPQRISLTDRDLRTSLPASGLEGQPVELSLHLLLASHQAPVQLNLSYQDFDYAGKAIIAEKKLEWNGSLLKVPLIFQSPGQKEIQLKDSSNHLLKALKLKVTPFPASVFPKKWEEFKNLAPHPERFHIWANLFYDEKTHPNQRQYVQITHEDRLIDRFLISSGAAGHITPVGEYKLGFKDFYPRSSRYNNTPMPFWSAINVNGNQGEYGFHSLEDGGYLYLLGKPASHGCIRLSRLPSVETDPQTGQKSWGDRGGARWIFDRVPPETPVTIFKQPLPDFEFQDYVAYL